MAGIQFTLAQRLLDAFSSVEPDADPVVRPSNRPGIDFQANGAMAVAKRLGLKPGEVAAQVVEAAQLNGMCQTVEATPQGFINLTLSDEYLASELKARVADARLGMAPAQEVMSVVVDYSHPNVAKEMHAGHLRTTVIGDALCRMLEFAGHHTIRENHVGDWGTPFGQLIEHLLDIGEEEAAHELSIGDLNTFYRQARAEFVASPEFQDRSRRRVVLLQSGDAETMRLWHILVDQSVAYFEDVYRKLGVLLTPEDVVGESFYNSMLPTIVDDLRGAGLLVESDGAQCVFPEGYTNREGEPLPLIVQKSDGGFGYAATDLAALKDRFGRLGADLVLYVVGAPQAQHLAMCFDVARAAGWIPDGKQAVHVSFGSVLGEGGKMLASRAGVAVKLIDLLDEAVQRATEVVADRSRDLSEEEGVEVARQVGIGAVKYADLSTDRTRDYVFDWDRMLSLDGNTAPYMLYARARCLSIFRRGRLDPGSFVTGDVGVVLAEPPERALALALLEFPTALDSTLATWSPHKLCGYLYDLAGLYTAFYENCPVLGAPSTEMRDSRLVLCAATAEVLGRGLGLLGIETPERM